MNGLFSTRRSGFTLIELLIVVAIIAILAAIAVPNFLEAQTRSKVSRCAADMRTIRTGLESYRIDTNQYPETDFGGCVFGTGGAGAGLDRLTTPVSYLSSVPKSPFKEDKMGGSAKRHAITRILYLYVCAKAPVGTLANGNTVTLGSPTDYDQDYQTDRRCYALNGGSSAAEVLGDRTNGFWELKSVGPNNEDDRNTLQLQARSYDPTNGTVSLGDVVVFSDIQGFAGRK